MIKRDVVVVTLTLLATLYFIYFYFAWEEIDAGTLGTLGDFVGGNINPILTFISTLLLIETLTLQRKATQAAEASAEETKKTVEQQGILIRTQIFESSFFNLINLCLEEYKNQKIYSNGRAYSGAKALYAIEELFCIRKESGENTTEIIESLDSLHGDIIYSTIKAFSSVFGFINDNAPEGSRDRYISLATRLTPTPVLYLTCITKIHTDWPMLKPFEQSGFFKKNGIKDLLNGYK